MTGAVGRLRERDDDGAFLILYALLAVALFVIGAIVLDIAALRQDRSGDRLASDLAATAGAAQLDRDLPLSTGVACQHAWEYFLDNTGAPTVTAAPPCTTAFPAVPCTDATTPTTVVGTAGPYRVEITSPVADGSALMRAEAVGGDRAQPADAALDGHQCERLAVRVVRERSQPFSAIVGLGARSTDVHSVARSAVLSAAGQVTELAAIDPVACGALTGEGSVELRVDGVGQAGDIAVDTDATACGGGSPAIDVTGTSRIQALAGAGSGTIRSRALTGPHPAAAYDPADTGTGNLTPVPSPAVGGFGRGAVDLRYNCNGPACAPGSDHIDRLRSDVGTGVPVSYLGVPVLPLPALIPCDIETPTVIPAGNWYVACPVFEIDDQVTFEGGLLVVQGTLRVVSGDCFAIASAICGGPPGLPLDSIVFLQSGDLIVENGADVGLTRTMVHLPGTAATAGSGRLQVSDPTGPGFFDWSAPLGGPFEDLALWGESGDGMFLEVNGSSSIEGLLFTPNTQMRLTPSGGASTLAAQVVAGRLRATGSGVLTLRPSADRAVSDTARSVRLVR